MKKVILVLVVAALVAGVAWRLVQARAARSAKGAGAPPPVPVAVAPVVVKAMPVEIRTFGIAEPWTAVDVKAQVAGLITNVPVREGQAVSAGELLFGIDSRSIEASLRQAEAGLARSRVQRDSAVKEAGRQSELHAKGFSADDALEQAQTAASALDAAVRADEAAVDSLRIQLDYCSIRSPIDGVLGALLVEAGNVVKANDATLATIHQIQPIKVRFAAPQSYLGEIRRAMAAGPLGVRFAAEDGASGAAEGTLQFMDNTVDPTTGTIALKGGFANADRGLWPGQYGAVTLVLGVEPAARVVPARAVQSGQRGAYVFVVTADQTVEDRSVEVSRTIGEEAVVTGRLEAGERVVTDGQFRLAPGAAVEIREAGARAASSAPVTPRGGSGS